MHVSRDDGSVDLREIGLALRHGWKVVALGALLGLALGVAVTLLVRERYEGRATVLVRASPDLASSALSQLGGLAEVLGGVGGAGVGSELTTQLEILGSRSVIGEVVDSLRLQAVVVSPADVPAIELFQRVAVDPSTEARRFEFVRTEEGFEAEGEGARVQIRSGEAAQLPGVSIILQRGELPDRFVIDFLDRQDAITASHDRLRTNSLTSDVAEIIYRGGDRYTAAAVPNLLVSEYLKRRTTTDRGVNQHRYDFLVGHTDSVTRELANAEAALRIHQETSGVLEPRLMGETQLTRAMELQGELETIDLEARALRSILDAGDGPIPPQELAAFPSFLRNPAINNVLSQLLELETERLILRQQREELDPDVIGLTEAIENLENQLRSLSRAYLAGLGEQRAELVGELSRYREILDRLPQQAEESFRRQREVERLSEIQLVLHSQLVQARLAAIGEGGEVHQIDTAVPPKKPAFPSNGFVLLLGILGGVFFGAVGAVSGGLLRQRVREPWEAELATGVPAISISGMGPISLPEVRTARTLLLLPLGAVSEARRIGERLVDTATLQGRDAVFADLANGSLPVEVNAEVVAAGPLPDSFGDDHPSNVVLDLPTGIVSLPVYHSGIGEQANQHRALLAHLEERFSLVVAVVKGLEQGATLSVIAPERPVILVAEASVVTRSALAHAVRTVERFGGRVSGVVLGPSSSRRNG